MDDYLKKIDGATIKQIADDAWYVTKGSGELTVYDDNSVEVGIFDIWDGSSVEVPEIKDFNWYIYNCAQLKFLADFVNNGNTLTEDQKLMVSEKNYNVEDIKMTEEVTVYLMSNLDLGARQSDGILKSGIEWTPIGNSRENAFEGNIEGNNKIIKGIYINNSSNSQGLIGTTMSTTEVETNEMTDTNIQNLIIKDSYVKATTRVGGIVGEHSGNIANCKNLNTRVIGTEGKIGGIVGQATNGSINGCENTGDVNGNQRLIGGICGVTWNTIVDCNNSGNIISTVGEEEEYQESISGGIVGLSYGEIKNCQNSGDITGNKILIGGIVGNGENNISDCRNTGKIYGNEQYIGGISGQTLGAISNSSNSGTVQGDKGIIGGITAINTKEISNCTNTGNILGKGDYVGGIVAKVQEEISNCTNSGNINGDTERIGGVVAQAFGSISNCNNTGSVQGKGMFVGGVAGMAYDTTNNCKNSGIVKGGDTWTGGVIGATIGTINTCENTGNVFGVGQAGGIAGEADGNIHHCINRGIVQCSENFIGGVVGLNKAQIINCENIGNVNGKALVGGISGSIEGDVTKCFNTGEIKARNEIVGGICGQIVVDAITLKNCYNTGKVIGVTNAIGGIVGRVTGTSGTISNNYNIGVIELQESATNVGGIIGLITSTAFTRSNNYYLEGIIETGGNSEGEVKQSDYMKTQEFVDLLNTGLSEKAWEKRSGENQEYPVLIGMNS